MRVVLDTNVIVSALISPQGFPAKILNLILNGLVTIVYDNHVLAEYMDVLGRKKFRFAPELMEPILAFIRQEGEYVTTEPSEVVFADEDDKVFYALYKSGGVDYLITGNIKHFPTEEGILVPSDFIGRV